MTEEQGTTLIEQIAALQTAMTAQSAQLDLFKTGIEWLFLVLCALLFFAIVRTVRQN